MRILVLFTTIIALSALLFAITLLMTSFYPGSIALHAAANSVVPTPPQTASPRHCDPVVARRKPPTPRPRTPPWEVLLNGTSRTNRTSLLYVHVWAAQSRRLGNQLFNYASLYGIAWKNGMVPLWPDSKTHLRTAFKPRIPTDQNNAIINVSD